MPQTYEDILRQRQAGQVRRRVEVGEVAPLRQGYSVGVAPAAPVRQIGPREAAGGLSSGVLTTEEKERRRRAKVAAGIPLGQEELD